MTLNLTKEDQLRLQQRLDSMKRRLKLVPPTTQLANLYGALWHDAENDCTVLVDQVLLLRSALQPFIDAFPKPINPSTRSYIEHAQAAMRSSKFVEDWAKLAPVTDAIKKIIDR
jgi:hypothetical protein